MARYPNLLSQAITHPHPHIHSHAASTIGMMILEFHEFTHIISTITPTMLARSLADFDEKYTQESKK